MTDSYSDQARREGEVAFGTDFAARQDAALVFIGRVRSPWHERGACPKNMRAARELMTAGAEAEVDALVARLGLRAGDPAAVRRLARRLHPEPG